jgi:enoyl-CoA hydratase
VSKVIEPTQLLAEAGKTLETIFKKGPVAIELAKKVVNEGTDLDLSSGLTLEATAFPMIFATDDKKEGVAAFLEKREAKFNRK